MSRPIIACSHYLEWLTKGITPETPIIDEFREHIRSVEDILLIWSGSSAELFKPLSCQVRNGRYQDQGGMAEFAAGSGSNPAIFDQHQHRSETFLDLDIHRLLTHISSPAVWLEECRILYGHVRSGGYAKKAVDSSLRKVDWNERRNLLATRNKTERDDSLLRENRGCVFCDRNGPGIYELRGSVKEAGHGADTDTSGRRKWRLGTAPTQTHRGGGSHSLKRLREAREAGHGAGRAILPPGWGRLGTAGHLAAMSLLRSPERSASSPERSPERTVIMWNLNGAAARRPQRRRRKAPPMASSQGVGLGCSRALLRPQRCPTDARWAPFKLSYESSNSRTRI